MVAFSGGHIARSNVPGSESDKFGHLKRVVVLWRGCQYRYHCNIYTSRSPPNTNVVFPDDVTTTGGSFFNVIVIHSLSLFKLLTRLPEHGFWKKTMWILNERWPSQLSWSRTVTNVNDIKEQFTKEMLSWFALNIRACIALLMCWSLLRMQTRLGKMQSQAFKLSLLLNSVVRCRNLKSIDAQGRLA